MKSPIKAGTSGPAATVGLVQVLEIRERSPVENLYQSGLVWLVTFPLSLGLRFLSAVSCILSVFLPGFARTYFETHGPGEALKQAKRSCTVATRHPNSQGTTLASEHLNELNLLGTEPK
ncbi:MAG TPA: hypothetical protein VN887_13075 [Candidatus Angelobacter sp.]|nr:hypothetical protein [Candidatus Angelobacter sp.]